ncbi:MAG: YHS domain-containing protein [Bacteroidetes bacterium]|nr:YHS domain-containing protein [Bacteroidota bacterium]
MERDLVCGLEIENKITAPATVYKGKTYFFCSDLCVIQFKQDPEKYVKKDDGEEHKHHQH